MLSVNKKASAVQLVTALIPVGIAIYYLFSGNWRLLPVTVAAIIAVIAVMPVYRRRESLWIFVITAAASIPVNIRLSILLDKWDILDMGIPFSEYIVALFLCMMLFSVEEIILGVAGRLIWRRQYKIKV